MNVLVAQLYSPSLDVIILVTAVVADVFLTAVVYLSNPRSATNKIFSLLTMCMVFWLIATYVARIPELVMNSLPIHRLGIFFAAPMSTLFFLLAHTMPDERIQLKKQTYIALLMSTFGMMAINLSPYAFVSNVIINGASKPQPGPGFIPFGVLSTLFSVLTVFWLLRKRRRSVDAVRKQLGLVLAGIVIMLALVISTILVPIVFFGTLQFLTFAPLYTLIFLGMTAYAITKYQLFNIKVLLTQALTLVLCLVLFAKLFGEETFNGQMIDGLVLAVVMIFGYFLVQSVRREVEQREQIQKLAGELQVANDQQTVLIHFITHQVKGFFTMSRNIFSLMLEDTLGPLNPEMRKYAQQGFDNTTKGVTTVQDILSASNIKKGTVTMNMAQFDLRALIDEILAELARVTREWIGRLSIMCHTADNRNFGRLLHWCHHLGNNFPMPDQNHAMERLRLSISGLHEIQNRGR